MRRPKSPLGSTLVALATLAGCGSGAGAEDRSGPATAAAQQKQTEDRIASIRNNPNMTDAQKAAAVGAFSSNQGVAKR